MRISVLALAACAPLAACNPAPADTGAAIAAVKAAEDGMLAAFKAHDAAKAASFYTADAEIMVPFDAAVRGSDAAGGPELCESKRGSVLSVCLALR